jgi:hypothetical protein
VTQRTAASWQQGIRMYAAHNAVAAPTPTGTATSLPAITKLTVAGPFSYQSPISLWARGVRYWNRQLSQAELQTVTTP